jgi:cytochrome c551
MILPSYLKIKIAMRKITSALRCFPLYIILFSALLLSCNTRQEEDETTGSFTIPEGLDKATEHKFRQYAVQGRQLYEQHCANCHKADGSGLGSLIPPLAQSDYLKNKERVLCIIRHGLNGSLIVNGVEYNQPMPANPQLTAIEIAEIATYIFNSWGNQGELVTAGQAREALRNCQENR